MPKSIAFLLSFGLVTVGSLITLASSGAHAQVISASRLSPQQLRAFRENQAPSQLTMPLVSAEQGRKFQQTRVVPASDAPLLSRQPPGARGPASQDARFAGVNSGVVGAEPVAATLGHPLPTSAMSPLGYPRAAFAIGKAPSASDSTKVKGVSTASPLSSAVIQ